MLIRAGFEIGFTAPEPAAMVLMLYLHPSRAPTIWKPERLEVEPPVAVTDYIDEFGNRCGRIFAPAGRLLLRSDVIVEDCGLPDLQVPTAPQHDVQDLPHDVLQFLRASRYCEVDSELKDVCWTLFAHFQPGWPRVQAICDFVHEHVHFDYQAGPRHSGRALRDLPRGAGRVGVCRDYTHLAVTFCRALNIPARYRTGYLGDIGVPAPPYPMDFSAWFEACLGGPWYAFDARRTIYPALGKF